MPPTALRILLSTLCVVAMTPHGVDAQEPYSPRRVDAPPVIDGELDDAAWQDAPYVSEFKTYQPDYGADMVGETHVYMAYDDQNLYFAFRSFDSEPEKLKASITSRDNMWRDDWVAINLDTFGDQQSLYAFYVNPMGIQGDSRFAAGQEDRSFDLVWYSSGKVDERGYTVEISIPVKSIRFDDAEQVRMGVIFERYVSRRSEAGTCPPLDPNQGDSWLTQMHPLVYQGLARRSLVEILPAVTYNLTQEQDQGRLATDERAADVSLTAKYGIASDLIADATVNPDFSQIEADAGQVDVNLRYDLYFPEKRPFFLEGLETFTLAATSASERDPFQSLLYTRTIVDPIAGVRLSGKAGIRNTVAAIYAVDELPAPDPLTNAEFAHFPVFRYKRALDDDSYLGATYAGRELGGSYNRVGGADGQLRVNQSSLLGYHALLSRTKADPGGAATNGTAVGLAYARGARNLDYQLVFKNISTDFQADMGFVTRTGVLQLTGLVRPKFYPGSSALRRIDAEAFTTQTRDHFSDRWETFNHVSLLGYLFGSLQLKVKYSYSTEIFRDERFETGGFHVFGGGQFTRQLYLGVLYRRIKAIFYSDSPFQGRSNLVTGNLIYQPSDRLQTNLSLTYADFTRESDGEPIYDYPILRGRLTYQANKYLFFRGIVEYNEFRDELLTDFLASFTYIPGTVIHVGYGSLYDKTRWDGAAYVPSDTFLQSKRRFFFKSSYLWRR